jgi:LacI family transcriptional regulator
MSIYDVARLSGVSLSTASKAMNGRADVREETRQRVMEVAKRINYHPSHLARGLARKCTENIGIISLRHMNDPVLTNSFYSHVLEAIEPELMERNYNLMISAIPFPEDGSMPLVPKMVREKYVDGMILLGRMSEAYLACLASSNIPFVVVDTYCPNVDGHYFLSNSEAGARMAAEHLLSKGHKSLGMIVSNQEDPSFVSRREGFVRACADLGLGMPRIIEARHESDPLAEETMMQILAGPNAPTGIFCCNDYQALLFMKACAKHKIGIPQQVSVMGFDDIESAKHCDPPLTTLRVLKHDLGLKAVRKLLELIAHPDLAKEIVTLPVELVERKSA